MGVDGILIPGVLAAGQFSTWLSAAVVGAAMLTLDPSLRRRVLRLLPLLSLAALAGAPALVNRLSSRARSDAVTAAEDEARTAQARARDAAVRLAGPCR